MLTFDGVWHFGEVFLFTDEIPVFTYRADGRQRVWRRVVSGLLMSSGPWWRWVYDMSRRMLWTTNTVHFIDGILNAQRYRDEILSPCCAIHPRPSNRKNNEYTFLGGKHNFATSTCFLRFDGQI